MRSTPSSAHHTDWSSGWYHGKKPDSGRSPLPGMYLFASASLGWGSCACTSTPAMRLQAPDRPLGFPTPAPAQLLCMQPDRLPLHHEPIDIAIPGNLASHPSPCRAHNVRCQSALCLVTVAAAGDNGRIPKSGIEHGCSAIWARSGNYARRADSLRLCVSASLRLNGPASSANTSPCQAATEPPTTETSAQPTRGADPPPAWSLQPPQVLPTRVGRRCSTALTSPVSRDSHLHSTSARSTGAK